MRSVAASLSLVVLVGGWVGLSVRSYADPPKEEGAHLVAVELEGRLLDPKERLVRFLGLEPGAVYDAAAQDRITHNLDLLNYRLIDQRLEQVAGGQRLHLTLEPARVARKIIVHGNFPLLEDDILRHLSVRSGSRLPADTELEDFLDAEAARVLGFLAREGYFGGSVRIVPYARPTDPEVDLEVRIELGQRFKLGSLRAQGNTAIRTDELFDRFSHCCFFWGRFRVSQMRDDARDVEQTLRDRGYPAARVTPDFQYPRDVDRGGKVHLAVRVVEKRKVVARFLGNRALTDRQLKAQLTIFSTGAYDEIELAESAKALQRTYQQHGYFESKVTFRRQRTGPSEEEISFLIDEGPELRVRTVEIVAGDSAPLHFSEEEIRDRAGLETKVFPRLGSLGLGEGGYVTTVQLQQDVERIVEFYRSQGFPLARARGEVARERVGLDALGAFGADVAANIGAKSDLYVRFVVDEGRREVVDHVEIAFVGPHRKTAEEIVKVLKLTNEQPYTPAAFAEDQKRIINLYKPSGHPYVQVSYADSWNATHDRITLRYQLREGPEAHFGEIILRGNFKTAARVILADLPFRSGDPFDLTKIDEAEHNLQTHQIFVYARVQPIGLDARGGQRTTIPILVTVQEKFLTAPDLIGSIGVQTDRLPYYYYVAAGLSWGNFLGLGSLFELRADFDWINSFSANVRYTDVHAFGPKWRFDLNGFYRQEVTLRLGPIVSYGGSVRLGRSITRALTVFGRYDLYQSQINDAFDRLAGPGDTSFVPDNTLISKLVTGVLWDRRVGGDNQPNPIMPTKGWLLSFALGWSMPIPGFALHNFLVLSGQALWLRPITLRNREFTFLANLRVDEGIPFGEPALPKVERFYAGGDTTTRGYDTDSLKTDSGSGKNRSVDPIAGTPGFRVIPEGGNIRLLSTIEFQFPIAKTPIGPWAGAVFYDVGAITNSWNQLAVSDFKHAVGITLLRLLSPIGAISLEYAYPLTQTLAEERWKASPWYEHYPGRIHFNWGIPLERL